MSSSAFIIQVGLPWDYSAFDAKSQAFVRDALEQGRQKMKAAGYTHYSTVDVSPELGIDHYIAYLKENNVDGVCVGFGIRRSTDLTAFLEQLVEATRVHAPQSKILFNNGPDSAVDAAQRWFPVK